MTRKIKDEDAFNEILIEGIEALASKLEEYGFTPSAVRRALEPDTDGDYLWNKIAPIAPDNMVEDVEEAKECSPGCDDPNCPYTH